MTIETTGTKRKRLLFRSWHRGTREMDLILGRFAATHLDRFSDEDLDVYDQILQAQDPDVYNWIIGRSEPPEELSGRVMTCLQNYKVFEK